MHFASVRIESQELPAVVLEERGLALVRDLLPGFEGDLLDVVRRQAVPELRAAAGAAPSEVFRSPDDVVFTAPYRHPRMLWGIGLNYVEHASDLAEGVPDEPASFIKGDHTVIGPGEDIPIPSQSVRTTAEAELGVVIGRYCRNVEPEQALDHLLGVTTVLDQTAEDILERNPRYLTRAKSFDTFFSFGPELVTVDEFDDVEALEVCTAVNGERSSCDAMER